MLGQSGEFFNTKGLLAHTLRDPAYPVQEKRLKVRRSMFEYRIDILKALRYEPKRLLKVSLETNISYLALKKALSFMVEKGLVGVSRIPPKTKQATKDGVLIFLTRKGKLVLERLEAAYAELMSFESREEDLVSDEMPKLPIGQAGVTKP